MPAIVAPLPQFFDLNGAPLEGGFIHIGAVSDNPETSPVSVYWDAALTQPAAQPLRTSRGFVVRGGTPAAVYVAGAYSLTARQANGVRVLYAPTSLQVDVASAVSADLADTGDTAKGDALLGAKRTAVGAVASTLHLIYERSYHDPVRDHGALFNGVADDTVAVQAALTAAGVSGLPVFLPGGTALCGQLLVPNCTVYGSGAGTTTIKQKNAANVDLMKNSGSGAAGNVGIVMRGFTVDGNYTNQTGSPHCINFDKATGTRLDELEVKNARGTGIVLTNCARTSLGPGMYIHTCGVSTAGYGVYNFCSDDLTVIGGDYNNCCIGIAVEASGAGLTSKNAQIIGPRCKGNRADHGQSGAGVHFEQSSGGDCPNGQIIGATCVDSTGVGINNTECVLTITGGLIANNTKTGIATTNAVGFNYSGVMMSGNGAGDSVGYQAAMRFDDSGLSPGSSGTVAACRARGATPDGFKTLSVNSAVRFIENDAAGFTSDYTMAGTGDTISRSARGSFTGTVTGCTTSPTGTITYSINGDVVTLYVPSISGTSNTTACTLTGMPAAIWPATQQSAVGVAQDNGTNVLSWIDITTSGVITLRNGTNGTFTNSGTKGAQRCAITYRLTA